MASEYLKSVCPQYTNTPSSTEDLTQLSSNTNRCRSYDDKYVEPGFAWKNCTSYDGLIIDDSNVTEYTCIYMASLLPVHKAKGHTGAGKNATFSESELPEVASYAYDNTGSNYSKKTKYWCDVHASIVKSEYSPADDYDYRTASSGLTLIQENCIGHKDITADLRNKSDDIPIFKPNKIISPDDFNKLIQLVKYQINERLKSPKYQAIYQSTSLSAESINEIERDDKDQVAQYAKYNDSTWKSGRVPGSDMKKQASLSQTLGNLIDCICKLQNNSNKTTEATNLMNNKTGWRRYVTGYDNNVIDKTTIKLNTGASQLDKNYTLKAFGKNGSLNLMSSNDKDIYDEPSSSKKNLLAARMSAQDMNNIVNLIKQDINDCICYSDCIQYYVCYCYGNCNYY